MRFVAIHSERVMEEVRDLRSPCAIQRVLQLQVFLSSPEQKQPTHRSSIEFLAPSSSPTPHSFRPICSFAKRS